MRHKIEILSWTSVALGILVLGAGCGQERGSGGLSADKTRKMLRLKRLSSSCSVTSGRLPFSAQKASPPPPSSTTVYAIMPGPCSTKSENKRWRPRLILRNGIG